MVGTPVANLGRLAIFVGGLIVLGFGIVAVALSIDTRFTGAIVLGIAIIVAAIAWAHTCRFVAPLGRWPRIVMVIACAVIVGMFCTNRDMGGDSRTPRGDGRYRPVLARGDGHMLYLMARSTALDGDWVFDNDLARFGDPWNQPRTKTGRKAIPHPIGPALVWTPLIWLAEGGAVIANVLGADIPLHGYTLWHHRIVFLSSAVFACGAVLLGRRVAQQLVGGSWSPTYAAIVVLLGTSLTYYATFMPSYGHAMDAFACAGFLAYWALTIGRRDVRRWVILGLLLGIATLIRVQELAMGCVVALEVLVRVGQHRRAPREAVRWLAGGALALIVATIVIIPQLLEWQRVFGAVNSLPQGARFTRVEAPMVMEVLFAPRNGWFSTTPIAYAGVIGLFCVPRKARLVAAGLLIAVALQVYLNSMIFDWWAGAAFGQRRMCNVTLPLVVGHAALLWRLGRLTQRWRRWIPHAVAIGVFGIFVTYNLARVGKLNSGLAASDGLTASCCDELPRPLRGISRAIYNVIGSPFEFPANAIYAIRHRVPLNRWDETVGNYPFIPPTDTLLDDRLWRQRGAWRLGNPGIEPYLVDGFSQSMKRGRNLRWTTMSRATALVPNLMPYGQRLTLWLLPGGARHATIRWNDVVVAEVELAGWTPVHFDLPAIAIHTNELTIEATPGPTTTDGVVGVGVSDLELQFLAPD